MRRALSLFLIFEVLADPSALACKCALISTAERFQSAHTVVRLIVTETYSDRVPMPFGMGGMVDGNLLVLRVLKAWKGNLQFGDLVYGSTPHPGGACDYPRPQVGTQIILGLPRISWTPS